MISDDVGKACGVDVRSSSSTEVSCIEVGSISFCVKNTVGVTAFSIEEGFLRQAERRNKKIAKLERDFVFLEDNIIFESGE